MTLNIGVIGTGAIGQDHIRRCSFALSGAKVVAVNDINLEQAKKVVNDLGIGAEVYADAHELINAANVEAILVTSWGHPPKSSCWRRSRPASRCSARSRWR